MNIVRKLMVSVAASSMCVVLVSDVCGMSGMHQRIADAQRIAAAAPMVNLVQNDFRVREDVITGLRRWAGNVHGSRLGAANPILLRNKIIFESSVEGIVDELLNTCVGSGSGHALNHVVTDVDQIVDNAGVLQLLGFIRNVENDADSAVDGQGATVNRALSASYADFVATLDAAGGGHGGGDGVLYDPANQAALVAGQARVDVLLDHILDVNTHIDTYFTDPDGAGFAHSAFDAIVQAANNAYDPEFGVDRVARWHFARCILEEIAAVPNNAGVMSFRAVRAFAAVLRGL